MTQRKITEPRILVVEDEPMWRRELSMMYCRVLRRTSLAKGGQIAACRECSRFKDCLPSARRPDPMNETVDNLHSDVVCLGDGEEAIRRLRLEPDKFHVLSLDLNLASQHVGSARTGITGLDVFDEAVNAQHLITVIAITGVARDSELPKLLTEDESARILTLEGELRDKLDGAYLFFNKMAEEGYGSVQQQVRQIERQIPKEKLLDLIKTREAVQERKDPSTLCLFFCLPEEYFDEICFRKSDKCVAFDRFSYSRLNSIELWQDDIFGPDDFDVQATRMLRLLVNFPLVIGRMTGDRPARGLQSVQFGTRRLEPRQQELLTELLIREFEGSSSQRTERGAETGTNVVKRHASALRKYLRTELRFQGNPIKNKEGLYRLDVPVSVFVCTEGYLGLSLTY